MYIVLTVLPTVVLVATIALVVMLVRYFLRKGQRCFAARLFQTTPVKELGSRPASPKPLHLSSRPPVGYASAGVQEVFRR
jgi:hypothetical protein